MGFDQELAAAAADIVAGLASGPVTIVIPVRGELDPETGTRQSEPLTATLDAVVHGDDLRRAGGADGPAAGRRTFCVERAALAAQGITPAMIQRDATVTRNSAVYRVHAVDFDAGLVRLECSRR